MYEVFFIRKGNLTNRNPTEKKHWGFEISSCWNKLKMRWVDKIWNIKEIMEKTIIMDFIIIKLRTVLNHPSLIRSYRNITKNGRIAYCGKESTGTQDESAAWILKGRKEEFRWWQCSPKQKSWVSENNQASYCWNRWR